MSSREEEGPPPSVEGDVQVFAKPALDHQLKPVFAVLGGSVPLVRETRIGNVALGGSTAPGQEVPPQAFDDAKRLTAVSRRQEAGLPAPPDLAD